MRLDAVVAKLVFGVGKLIGMLHQETRLTHELAGTFRLNAIDGVAAIVNFAFFVFLVFERLVLGRNKAVFEDHVEVGLNIVRVDNVFVVIVIVGRKTTGRRCRGGLVFLVGVANQFVVFTDKRIVFITYKFVFVWFAEFVGIELNFKLFFLKLGFVFKKVVVVSHCGAAS
jgi:hypothetical protein